MNQSSSNVDPRTVASFGHEWASHDQSGLTDAEKQQIFTDYFGVFPWDSLPPDAQGFDMGCGSGRWASVVAPRVGTLNCIDAAGEALGVAKRNLAAMDNVKFHHATTDTAPLEDASQDFGYSLGVLHHIPDTQAALADCTRLLKPGAPFLLYLYYRFDNRPAWFRALWKGSELIRGGISRMPSGLKNLSSDVAAAGIYWPLARGAALAEKLGANPDRLPLSYYRDKSFLTMRTDSRDRFGTPLEQRFTRDEIKAMMESCGLEKVEFSDTMPYWVAVGFRK
ncbi:MAG: class I SAM-dependent methyltransferase [Sphingomonadaceae bacterium]|nr:class I SAM-dependent methyltransferase [Sphingomonadaceae bacterium]MCP5392775.1 class I SAM-dependent methyltransferase [Sphingomonadaceae bacterium]